MGLVRLVVFGAIALTVVYFAVTWFARSTRREKLEKEWDAANRDGDHATRRAEVEKGVDAFRASLVYRAFALIYIVPTIAVIVVLIATNWN